jgi:amino acid permease
MELLDDSLDFGSLVAKLSSLIKESTFSDYLVAEETERQRETLPHAVRRGACRVMFYYVGQFERVGMILFSPVMSGQAAFTALSS